MRDKKIVGIILAVVLCVSVFAACGDGDSNLTNRDAALGAEIALTIDGVDITADEYRYCVAVVAEAEVRNRNSAFTGNFSEVNWDEKVDGEKTLAQLIEEKTLEELVNIVTLTKLGEENNVNLTDEEKKVAEDAIENIKTSYGEKGEEAVQLAVAEKGLISVDGYKRAREMQALYSKVSEDIDLNRDKYINEELTETLKDYKSDEMVSAQHVLIMTDSETHAAPKATIDEVHARAVAGEDFNALMTEFNEDTGEPASGYTFGKGEMVPEFEEAAFALDYNQISDVVPSDYGYHVIKRIIGMTELTAYLSENAEIKKNDDVIGKNAVKDIMVEIHEAKMEIKKLNEAK